MPRRLIVALAVALAGATLLGTGAPGAAQPPPPVIGACPDRDVPPPAVDLSEVPLPGAPVPSPLPLPDEPVGGERMGECGLVLPAGAPPLPPDITAASWLVADLDTGEVLAAQDPHARHRPASTIKILTALVAADALNPDLVVPGLQEDADQEGSSAGIGPGGSYTVRQLLAGLFLASGNDAAHALARQLGGVPATLAAMNERARELGALDTRAATPSGLDGPGMSTSVYDLALVFREVLDRPVLAETLRTRQIDFPGYGPNPGFVLGNDNRLLTDYPGALGGKTGFTDDARHTYLGAAERDGRRLVAVLVRGEQRPIRMSEQAGRLLDYGFGLPPGDPVGELVDGPPAPEPTPTPTPTTPDSPAGTSSAAAPADQGGGGPPAAVWWLGAVGVLAVLGGLLVRRRRRQSSRRQG